MSFEFCTCHGGTLHPLREKTLVEGLKVYRVGSVSTIVSSETRLVNKISPFRATFLTQVGRTDVGGRRFEEDTYSPVRPTTDVVVVVPLFSLFDREC